MSRRRRLLRWGVSSLAGAPFVVLAFLVADATIEMWPEAEARYRVATTATLLIAGLGILALAAYDLTSQAMTPPEDPDPR